jgi:hypothetical protein
VHSSPYPPPLESSPLFGPFPPKPSHASATSCSDTDVLCLSWRGLLEGFELATTGASGGFDFIKTPDNQHCLLVTVWNMVYTGDVRRDTVVLPPL